MVSRILKAREAYKKKDLKATKAIHGKSIIESHDHSQHATSGKYIGDAVYGAIDGIVTTFAIVSGVVGAELNAGIILILGFANLFADGFSMATGNYLSSKSEKEYHQLEYQREKWEVENYPKGEIDEIREIYSQKGFKGKDLERAVEIITSDKERWVRTMMIEELGLIADDKDPFKAALVTFVAFVTCGLFPLLTFIALYLFPELHINAFVTACVITGITIFVVGSLRSIVIDQKWWKAGLEMLFVGGSAAVVAYYVGYLLKGLA